MFILMLQSLRRCRISVLSLGSLNLWSMVRPMYLTKLSKNLCVRVCINAFFSGQRPITLKEVCDNYKINSHERREILGVFLRHN